jgi:spermidine/putrescine transport system permease protein
MVLFTLVPFLMICYYAVTDNAGNLSLKPLSDVVFYRNVYLNSFIVALVSTAICLVLAYPLSYMLSRARKSTQRLGVMLLMLPMWMNFLLRIYGWMVLLQNNGPIDTALSLFGLDIPLIGNRGAVILGMVYEYLPFMVLPIYTVMGKIDGSLVEAASDLGANRLNVFKKVILPLSVPGIISGVTMVFVPSASTFLVAQYLGSPDDLMIGDVIEKIFISDFHTGSALSLVLMLVIVVFLIIMNKFGDEEALGV